MSESGRSHAGGPARRLLLALLPQDDWSQALVAELDGELERLRASGAVQHPRWWYAKQVLAPQTLLFLAKMRRRARTKAGAAPTLGVSWLDVKLGVRMLHRQPALTAVAVFALALGIPVGLIPFHVAQAMNASLPYHGGERIVALENRDLRGPGPVTAFDFHVWREDLTTFEAVGAATTVLRNVVSEDGRAAPVQGSEISASAFEIVRVAALLGRPLVEADERPGAPDVVVLGHDLWRSRLGGDPGVLGRSIRIGGRPYQVVGVMPEGFLFPDGDHYWLPLRARPLDYARGEGPDLDVFGRLAVGVSMEEANTELSAIGRRTSAAYPDTHGTLRAEVRRFTGSSLLAQPEFWVLQLLALLLLAVACGNVGTLMLARAATRSGEIAVRTALGASRARVVSQLFVEALVLAVLGAGLGLLLGDVVANRFQAILAGVLPFWVDLGVSWETALVALLLATFSATVSGVVPALKATGRGVHRSLQRATAGASGIRFGGLSTAMIMAEVALSVAFLAIGAQVLPSVLRDSSTGMGIPSEEYLTALLFVPPPAPTSGEAEADSSDHQVRVLRIQQELVRRLSGEAGVRGVALASSVPGDDHLTAPVQVEGREAVHRVRVARVDVDFLVGLEGLVVNGRDFHTTDVEGVPREERVAVIVNTSFVDEVLEGSSPLGRRFRYVRTDGMEPGPWLEIVGVVGHLGMNEINPDGDAGFYEPVARGELNPVRVAVHVGADPTSFASRLRQIALQVDEQAILREPLPADENAERSEPRLATFWLGILVSLIAGVAVLLSAAGLFALMSFTVSERTREIGIRTALGAHPGSIVRTIATRAFAQIALGVAAGLALRQLIDTQIGLARNPWVQEINQTVLLTATAGVILLVGLLSCLPPLLRGLRIRPVEALREG